MELVLEDDDSFFHQPLNAVSSRVVKITWLYLMFLFTWQSFFRVSDVGMNVLLRFFATFLTLLVTVFGLHQLMEVVSQFPKTV